MNFCLAWLWLYYFEGLWLWEYYFWRVETVILLFTLKAGLFSMMSSKTTSTIKVAMFDVRKAGRGI
jgi:hypothetical protein